MSRFLSVLSVSLALTAACLAPSLAQTKYYPAGVIQPESSKGGLTPTKHAKTYLKMLQVYTRPATSGAQPLIGTGLYGSYGPKDLRSFYKIPATAKGHGYIVIVDAFDTSTIVSDFNTFSNEYGLPTENGTGNALEVFAPYGYTSGSANGTGWDVEACLDTQVAHAIAPNAVIVLVEAASNSLTDLYNAVSWGRTAGPTSELSMSWGSSEGGASSSTESILTSGNGINFASTGDSGAFYGLHGNYTSYPASSPNVVAVGGTTTVCSDSTPGKLLATIAWEEGGGGPSALFGKPSYQSGIIGTDPTYRSLPDLSANADPQTPFALINTSYYGVTYVFFVGGTSESSPILAALQNDSGDNWGGNTVAFLSHIYGSIAGGTYTKYFNDVKAGYNGFLAGTRYDMATGLGTPKTLLGL